MPAIRDGAEAHRSTHRYKPSTRSVNRTSRLGKLTALDVALYLAAKGLPVFPVRPTMTPGEVNSVRNWLWDCGFRPVPILNADHADKARAGKAPLGANWTDLARHDPPNCLRYQPVGHAMNTGILCDGLRAFDFDINDPQLAGHCRALVISRVGEPPLRFRVNSGRCLLLCRAAEGEPRKISIAGKLGKIEVLGRGQQFVAHGLHPSGVPLDWHPDPPWRVPREQLPAVTEEQVHALLTELAPLIEAEPPARSNGQDHTAGKPQADPLRIAAALQAIPNDGPADWEWWNRVGMAVWRATGGSNLGFEAFDHWSRRNPTYSAEETKTRWDHYFTSPPTQIGAGTLFRMAAEARKAAAPTDAVKALVAKFNASFFVLNENGKTCIYAPRSDPILNRRLFDRMSFSDFEKLYANRFIEVGKDSDGKPIRRNAAKLWLRHDDRRQFIGGVVFDPANRDPNPSVFNLWEGFAVEPRAGSWAKLQAHISTVICSGAQAVTDYLLDWMADLVQNPAKQGEVAIVLRGVEGCGKGTFAQALKYLLGQHGLAISNARHLTGNFNAHLRDVVLLFADEAFYAGDKQGIGVLKTLITEPYLTIEGKYQNAYQAPNYLHVIMASNEDWVVPASLKSRRWLVLDVSPEKASDHNYFAVIYQELRNGGYEAMLYDLLRRGLSKSNLRAVPVTDALHEQRQRSVDTTTAWWLDCLHRGYVFESKHGLEDHWQQWHEFLATEVLFASYIRYCRDHHERHPLTRELFGKCIASTGAKQQRKRNQPVGEHIVEAFSDGRTSRVVELIRHPQPLGYTLGTLANARQAFSDQTGLKIKWEPDEPSPKNEPEPREDSGEIDF